MLEVAERLRKDKIPSDAVYLDIDYQVKNRPFTINTQTFPDMPGMVKTLHDEKFHVVAITDPHIAYLPGKDYAPFNSGTAGDEFVKNPDGTVYRGEGVAGAERVSGVYAGRDEGVVGDAVYELYADGD